MKISLLSTLIFVVFTSYLPLASGEEIPLNVREISERVIMIEPGEHAKLPHIAAIKTERGIVVIDTCLFPSVAEAARKKIEEHFGTDEFAYVINTHSHFDHTNGNQMFADAVIIGHENCVPAMERFARGLGRFIPRREANIQQQEIRLSGLAADSPEALEIKERAAFNRTFIKELQSGFKSTAPAITFDDRLTLDLGDISIKMVYYGKAHTDSDIVVFIPEEKLVFYGDLFSRGFIQFGLDSNLDVDRWLEVLDEIEAFEPGKVIGGHAIELEPGNIVQWQHYVKELWTAVNDARKEGLNLEEARSRYKLEDKLAILNYVDPEDNFVTQQHARNIQFFWRNTQESASQLLESRLAEVSINAAIGELNKIKSSGSEDYYFEEREFNALGYRLLYGDKYRAAIAVLKHNTELFPGSWNAWDSLGEGYAWVEMPDEAIAAYKKSLELNPANENGKNNLKQIYGKQDDLKRQTKEKFNYKAGEIISLKGPYLGQRLPGLVPEVFAPGIVSTAGNFEFSGTFSPDGKEYYFTRRADDGGENQILVSRQTDLGWTAPELAPFAHDSRYWCNEPHITADGKRLFFGSNRPRPDQDENERNYGIWYVDRKEDGWDEAEYFGSGMFVSSTQTGTLYMNDAGSIVSYNPVGNEYGDARQQRFENPEKSEEVHPCISPDGTFIIYDSTRTGGQGGEGDLYVSYRNPDGSWSEGINLGDAVNNNGTNFCAHLSPDGNYLFYTKNRDIYWVSTRILNVTSVK